MEKSEKLRIWQQRLASSETAYQKQLNKMDDREAQYLGKRELRPLTENDRSPCGKKETPHVRNITAELIEAQVSSDIPQPKVTARRKQDEPLAKIIEDMLRNELDRLPMEYINDIQERTVPIQGGGFYHVEWDNAKRTHDTTGEVAVAARHPKQVIPQEGVYTALEDMDYIILRLPTTKERVKAVYGVDMSEEGEELPELRGSGEETPADEMVTLYVGYAHNGRGGISKYAWVRDTELENLEDYQARRLRRCRQCGQAEPREGDVVVDQREMLLPSTLEDALFGGGPRMVERSHVWHEGDPCPFCGAKEWEWREEEQEEIWEEIVTAHGKVIPGQREEIGEDGSITYEPTKIPAYKPNVYPLVLQRNVSVFGQLLGDSDVDKVADAQNTTNRIEKKIIDRIIKAGTRVIMPSSARHSINSEDQEVWFLDSAADVSMIRDINFTGNLEYEMTYLAQVYEEARQAIGITRSFQGQEDATAKSGVAKQFSAAQAAGRLESKRTLKHAAYADLFRLIFQFRLAYADEPRPVVSQDSRGNKTYDSFDRYDFLERDESGAWYWNDQFLFSCDASAALANNRERMWEETISFFSAGCFGDPTQTETLVALWTKLELLHYPGAADTRAYLEEKLEREQAARAQQMAQAPGGPGGQTAGGMEAAAAAVDQRARQDAMAAVFGGQA